MSKNYQFSSKKDPIGSILDEEERCTHKNSSLTRLNDVPRKALLQEAKQKARSNEFVLRSEHAEFKANHCAAYRNLRGNGAYCSGQAQEGGGGGGGGKGFCFTNVF